MYIHKFFPADIGHVEVQSKAWYLLNVQSADKKCFMSICAYQHPAEDLPTRFSNHNKQVYINGIKIRHKGPYEINELKKTQKLNKGAVLFNLFYLNKDKTINPVLINQNGPKRFSIL